MYDCDLVFFFKFSSFVTVSAVIYKRRGKKLISKTTKYKFSSSSKTQFTYFHSKNIQKVFWKSIDFVENLEIAGGRGSCSLRHYDAVRTAINMWFTPNHKDKKSIAATGNTRTTSHRNRLTYWKIRSHSLQATLVLVNFIHESIVREITFYTLVEAATGSGLWKKVFLKILHISKENTYAGFSFNKVVIVKAFSFIKKRLQHRYFRVKFPKFIRTPFWRAAANGWFVIGQQNQSLDSSFPWLCKQWPKVFSLTTSLTSREKVYLRN